MITEELEDPAMLHFTDTVEGEIAIEYFGLTNKI